MKQVISIKERQPIDCIQNIPHRKWLQPNNNNMGGEGLGRYSAVLLIGCERGIACGGRKRKGVRERERDREREREKERERERERRERERDRQTVRDREKKE